MSSPTPFHRLFGCSWIDFFDGTDVQVETELDLSTRLQLLDVAIIRKVLMPLPRPMPDGLTNLTKFTLVTFKSYRQPLDADAIWELIAHFVNYRKRVSPSLDQLLPSEDFQLFAVAVRHPATLADWPLVEVSPGVYDVAGFGLRVRIIVVNRLPLEEQNAMLHLFSSDANLIRYGQENYRPHSVGTSTLLYQLLQAYTEDPNMSEKMKELVRQTIEEILSKLPPEERLKGLPAEERLKGLPTEERLKGLSTDEVLKALPPDEVLKALPPEVLEALTRQIKGNGTAPH